VVNYVIAARPSLRNFMIADTDTRHRIPGAARRDRHAPSGGPAERGMHVGLVCRWDYPSRQRDETMA
jgi:hypothetical protein